MTCLVCGNMHMQNYYYPEVRFNNKVFKYFECADCRSAQIDPMPDKDDYQKMYGVNDHRYLTQLKENESVDFNRSYPRYNHQKYQMDFFSKYKYASMGKTLLDYGCGSGFYMDHAGKQGMDCTGVEFDPKFAALLKSKTGLNIVSLEDIKGKTFDLIHLGHVLEHMEDPKSALEMMKQYAHKDSVFIIDGPLEKNRCLTRFFIKMVSLIKRNKFNTYPPQHLTFTNYDSQLLLFQKCGLNCVNYEVQEQMFPLPEQFEITRPFRAVQFMISRVSINLSKLYFKWGNIFHYAGKLNNKH